MQSSEKEIDAEKQTKKDEKAREEVKAGYFCRCLARARTRVTVLRFPAVLFSLPKTAVNRSRSDHFRSLNFEDNFSLTVALLCKICSKIDGT